jgi:hypothetical protein
MLELAGRYFVWHYTTALADLFHIVRNFLWSATQIFPISFLLRTFAMPFKRIQEEKGSMLDFENFIQSLVANTLMRLVGMLLRTMLIFCGLVLSVVVFCLGFLFTIAWICAPLITLFLFGFGTLLVIFGLA